MIYGRMGGAITLLREASIDDVLAQWGVKPTDKRVQAKKDREMARSRCDYGMMWWGVSAEDKTERIYELAYCKADGGFAEIDDTRKALMGHVRHAEAVGQPV